MPRRAISYEDATQTGATSPFADAHLVNAYNMAAEDAAAGGSGVQLGDMKSALDRLMADVAGEAQLGADGKSVVGLRVEAVTEGVKARQFTTPERGPQAQGGHVSSPLVHEEDVQMEEDEDAVVDVRAVHKPGLRVDIPEQSKGVSAILHTDFTSPLLSPPQSASALSRRPSNGEAIRRREELIKAKKREARRREAASMGDSSDESGDERGTRSDVGRPNRRHSKSTSEELVARRSPAVRRREIMSEGGLLDILPIDDEEDPLADSIDRELQRLGGSAKVVSVDGFKGNRKTHLSPLPQKYHVRERSETIYASADASHVAEAGETDNTKAWRPVKRPSDMVCHRVL